MVYAMLILDHSAIVSMLFIDFSMGFIILYHIQTFAACIYCVSRWFLTVSVSIFCISIPLLTWFSDDLDFVCYYILHSPPIRLIYLVCSSIPFCPRAPVEIEPPARRNI